MFSYSSISRGLCLHLYCHFLQLGNFRQHHNFLENLYIFLLLKTYMIHLFRLSSLYRQTAETEKERADDLLEAADYCEQVLIKKNPFFCCCREQHKSEYCQSLCSRDFENKSIYVPCWSFVCIVFFVGFITCFHFFLLLIISFYFSLPRSWSFLPHTRLTKLSQTNYVVIETVLSLLSFSHTFLTGNSRNRFECCWWREPPVHWHPHRKWTEERDQWICCAGGDFLQISSISF